MSSDKAEIAQDRRPKILGAIYEWANLLTGEMSFGSYEYIWTKPATLLLERLKHSSGGLFIALIGLQGVGKSSAAMEIAYELQNALKQQKEAFTRAKGIDPDKLSSKVDVLHVKHLSSGSLLDSIERTSSDRWYDTYAQSVGRELQGRMKSSRTLKEKVAERLGFEDWEHAKIGDVDPEQVKSFLPARVFKENKLEAIETMLCDIHTLIIDLPDYSKTDKRLMVKDLNEVQRLWNELCFGPLEMGVPNFVVVVQKEMLCDHFLFGKMDTIEIKPFSPDELVDAYSKIWAEKFSKAGIDLNTWPFEKESLLYLARLSRGIFRRFLRYIRMCLETCLPFESFDGKPLDLKRAQEAVDLEQVRKDREAELSDIFRREETKRLAAKILGVLEEKRELSQKALAESLNVSESATSRILDPLEEYGFV